MTVVQVDGQVLSGESVDSPSSELTSSGEKNVVSKRLHRIYTQRIPADCKVGALLLLLYKVITNSMLVGSLLLNNILSIVDKILNCRNV